MNWLHHWSGHLFGVVGTQESGRILWGVDYIVGVFLFICFHSWGVFDFVCWIYCEYTADA